MKTGKIISTSPLRASESAALIELTHLPVRPDQLQQINHSDCGLHVINQLGEKVFGFPNTIELIQNLRQKLPVLILAVAFIYQSNKFQIRSTAVNSVVDM